MLLYVAIQQRYGPITPRLPFDRIDAELNVSDILERSEACYSYCTVHHCRDQTVDKVLILGISRLVIFFSRFSNLPEYDFC